MAIISKEGLLKVLVSYNPWWKTGVVNPKLSKTYKRFAFYEAMKRLNQTDIRRTVVLTGTRRVGKTTIQYQMIEALLQSGVPPQKIVFISMDHPMLKLSAMNEILDCYHENIYPDQDVYYFFDEIQYAQDWDKWLKTIYDMQPDTKVVATISTDPFFFVTRKGDTEIMPQVNEAMRQLLLNHPSFLSRLYDSYLNVTSDVPVVFTRSESRWLATRGLQPRPGHDGPHPGIHFFLYLPEDAGTAERHPLHLRAPGFVR